MRDPQVNDGNVFNFRRFFIETSVRCQHLLYDFIILRYIVQCTYLDTDERFTKYLSVR